MIKKSVAVLCLIIITLITAILSSCVTHYIDKDVYLKKTKAISDKEEKVIKDNKIEEKKENTLNTNTIVKTENNGEKSNNQTNKPDEGINTTKPQINDVLVSVEIIKTKQTAKNDDSKNKIKNDNKKASKKETKPKQDEKDKIEDNKKDNDKDIQDLKVVPVVVHRVENADKKQYIEQQPIEPKKNDEKKIDVPENEPKTIYNTIVVE